MDNKFNVEIPIYYINIPRYKTRSKHMENLIKKYDLKNITRVEGYDKDVNKDMYVHEPHKARHDEYFCTMSHLKAIELFFRSGQDKAIFFEDDVSFEYMQYWDKTLKEYINTFPGDWEMVQLGVNTACDMPVKLIKYNHSHNGTFAYILKRLCAQKILNKVKKTEDGKYIFNGHKPNTIRADMFLYKHTKQLYSIPLFTFMNFKSTLCSNIDAHQERKVKITNKWINYYYAPHKHKINFPVKYYYINLDRSTERKMRTENLFNIFGINYQRISAINAKNENDFFIHDVPQRAWKVDYACTCSHIKAISQFLASNNEMCIVCEDDISFEYLSYWTKNMSEYLKTLPKNWDIIMLAVNTTLPIKLKISKYVRRINSTVCYLINRKGALKVLKKIDIKGRKIDFCKTKKSNIRADVFIYSGLNTFYLPIFTYNCESVMNHNNHVHQVSKDKITKLWKH